MIYTCKYKSPLGEILLAADEMFDNLCDRFENVCNIAGRKFSVNGYEFYRHELLF